jgi:hypothetical protein
MTCLRSLSAGFALVLIISCTSTSPPARWDLHGNATSDQERAIADWITQYAPGASTDFYTEVFDAAYDPLFAATVRVLNQRDDLVTIADSDKGMILTRRTAHWVVLGDIITQYLVVFHPISGTQTRMVFKVFMWQPVYSENDSVNPIGTEVLSGAVFTDPQAGRFVETIRNALK